jgi:hypothetical protein
VLVAFAVAFPSSNGAECTTIVCQQFSVPLLFVRRVPLLFVSNLLYHYYWLEKPRSAGSGREATGPADPLVASVCGKRPEGPEGFAYTGENNYILSVTLLSVRVVRYYYSLFTPAIENPSGLPADPCWYWARGVRKASGRFRPLLVTTPRCPGLNK